MKRFSVLSLVILFSMPAYAQEKFSPSGKQDPPPAGAATPAPEEIRMRALEERVRTLAEEVALLRGELKTIRDSKSADPATGNRRFCVPDCLQFSTEQGHFLGECAHPFFKSAHANFFGSRSGRSCRGRVLFPRGGEFLLRIGRHREKNDQ